MAPGARRVVVVVTGRDEQLYISVESFNISRSFDTNLCYGKGGDPFRDRAILHIQPTSTMFGRIALGNQSGG